MKVDKDFEHIWSFVNMDGYMYPKMILLRAFHPNSFALLDSPSITRPSPGPRVFLQKEDDIR